MSLARRAVLALCLASAARSAGAQGSVRGTIIESITARPIRGAVVTLNGSRVSRSTMSDSAGRYAFADVASGVYALRVAQAAYRSNELGLIVGSKDTITLDVSLIAAPGPDTALGVVPLGRVIVRAPRIADTVSIRDDARLNRGTQRAPWRVVSNMGSAGPTMHGALSDVGALSPAARNQPAPGLARTAHTLLVWGSGEEQGRVLVDGIPLDAPLQVAGLLPMLDDAAAGGAVLRTGGASPEYDGGSAYIADFSTRDPVRAPRIWGEFDPLVTRLGIETRAGRGAAWIAARRINSGLAEWVSGDAFHYSYDDVVARAGMPAGAGSLAVTFVATAEGVPIPRDQGRDAATWKNLAASARWGATSDTSQRSIAVTGGRGMIELPLLSLTAGRSTTIADRITFTARGARVREHRTDAYGIELNMLRLSDRNTGSSGAPGGAVSSGPTSFAAAAIGGDCDSPAFCWTATSAQGSVFGEMSRELAARTRLTAGARLNLAAASRSTGVHVLPRTSVTREFGTRTVIGASIGWYSQLHARPSRDSSVVPELGLRRSVQGEIGAAWSSGAATLSAVASLSRQPARADAPVSVVRGFDASARWSTRDADASIGYSATFDPSRARSNRLRSLVVGRASARVGSLQPAISLSYMARLPYTTLVLERPVFVTIGGGGADSSFDPVPRALLRFDASISGARTVTIGARAIRLEPIFCLRNLLRRSDAPFYYRSRNGASAQPLAALPFMASVGLRWDGALQRTSKQ